jgi:hypothetical protein
MSDVTRILAAIEHGDPQAASQLLPLVYDELRKLAAQKMVQEAPAQTLQPTAAPKVVQDGVQLHRSRVGVEMLASGGRALIEQFGDFRVWNEREDINVLRKARRPIIVIGDGTAIGALQLEPFEDVFKPVENVDQAGKDHPSLSQNAM